jgi:hypothetical protein
VRSYANYESSYPMEKLDIMEITMKEEFISIGPRHFNVYVNLLLGKRSSRGRIVAAKDGSCRKEWE